MGHGLDADAVFLGKHLYCILVFEIDIVLAEIGNDQVVWHEKFGGKSVCFDFLRISCK